MDAITAACHSKECAPPPAGVGGSSPLQEIIANSERILAKAKAVNSQNRKKKVPWKPMMTREEAEEWARDSKVQELTTFVGTKSKIERIKTNGFDLGKSNTGSGNVWGTGLYSSLSSKLVVLPDQNEDGSWGKRVEHPESAKYKTWKKRRPGGVGVVRLKVNVQNPATIEVNDPDSGSVTAMEHWVMKQVAGGKHLEGVDEVLGNREPTAADFTDPLGEIDWDAYERAEENFYNQSISERFSEFLQKNGYDSLIVTEDGFSDAVGGSQIVVFDPKNVTVVEPETDPSHHLFASAALVAAASLGSLSPDDLELWNIVSSQQPHPAGSHRALLASILAYTEAGGDFQDPSAYRLTQLQFQAQSLHQFVNFHTDRENRDWHGRFSKTLSGRLKQGVKKTEHTTSGERKNKIEPKSAKVLDVPSTKYGMKFDRKNARRPDVRAGKAWKGWDALPTTGFRPKAQPIHANEQHLQSKAIDKVVSGKVPLRTGYDPHILIDEKGEAHVIDGHHRVAMYMGMGREVMPSKVYDVRKSGPLPDVSTAKKLIDKALESKAQKVARKNLEAVKKVEKDATPDLQEVAERLPGGHLLGLDYRFKSEKSLTRKIADKSITKGIEPDDVKITDSLRYTFAFDHDTMAESTQAAMDSLVAKGYTLIESENFWSPGDAYNGINTLFQHQDGTIFEVQFHTDKSFQVKDKDIHKFYEEFRLPATNGKRRKELFDIMTKISDSQPTPPGIEKICCLKHRPL